jgi:hypothetical protein
VGPISPHFLGTHDAVTTQSTFLKYRDSVVRDGFQIKATGRANNQSIWASWDNAWFEAAPCCGWRTGKGDLRKLLVDNMMMSWVEAEEL